MNALTLNNISELDFFYPQAISISQDEESAKALKQAETLEDKFLLLRNDVGDELFNQLSYDDQLLMANTAGVIDFGRPIDLDRVEKDIENYDHSY